MTYEILNELDEDQSTRRTRNDRVYTCYCAWPDTPRGYYDEEIDVVVLGHGIAARDNRAEIRRTAQAELDANYDAGGTVKKIVGPRVGLFL